MLDPPAVALWKNSYFKEHQRVLRKVLSNSVVVPCSPMLYVTVLSLVRERNRRCMQKRGKTVRLESDADIAPVHVISCLLTKIVGLEVSHPP
jgi:hypothetical protein